MSTVSRIHLLGMKWHNKYYVDLALLFGLHSAPFISHSIANMLVKTYQIPDLCHYMDNFMTAGSPDSPQSVQNLSTAMAVCNWLGLPLHPAKCIGPAPVLVILGIELDSVNQVPRLPADKLLVRFWLFLGLLSVLRLALGNFSRVPGLLALGLLNSSSTSPTRSSSQQSRWLISDRGTLLVQETCPFSS